MLAQPSLHHCEQVQPGYPEKCTVGSHPSIDSLCQEQRIQMQNIVILIPVLAIQPHISMNATYLRFS